MSNGAPWEKINFSFNEAFVSIDKVFILQGRLGTRVKFYEVLAFS